MIIAIDYDDTFTADPALWRVFIDDAIAHGHRVICVSARRDELGHRQELEHALPEGVKVLLSYDAPKRQFAKRHGLSPDVWIDDMPESIPLREEVPE